MFGGKYPFTNNQLCTTRVLVYVTTNKVCRYICIEMYQWYVVL